MDYFFHIAIFVGIFAILAMSLDLVVGQTGLISVAHAAFWGIGAYTTALFMRHYDMNFFLAMVIGVVVSIGAGFGIGIVLSRFRGDYYVLATLGFNLIVFSILLNWKSLTRGPLGIPGIDRPSLWGFAFDSGFSFTFLTVAFVAVIYGISYWITRSSFGRALNAIREDEDALQVFGYCVRNYKLVIFVASAGMAAIAGALYASYISFIDPIAFHVTESVFILSIIIIGGLANMRGAILGAVCLVLLPEVLRFIGFSPDIAAYMRQLVYGLLLVVMMLYRPQGLLGGYTL